MGQTKRPRILAGTSLLQDKGVLISGGHGENFNVEGGVERHDPATRRSDFVKPLLP